MSLTHFFLPLTLPSWFLSRANMTASNWLSVRVALRDLQRANISVGSRDPSRGSESNWSNRLEISTSLYCSSSSDDSVVVACLFDFFENMIQWMDVAVVYMSTYMGWRREVPKVKRRRSQSDAIEINMIIQVWSSIQLPNYDWMSSSEDKWKCIPGTKQRKYSNEKCEDATGDEEQPTFGE